MQTRQLKTFVASKPSLRKRLAGSAEISKTKDTFSLQCDLAPCTVSQEHIEEQRVAQTAMLNRFVDVQSLGASHLLLNLQRQYGNYHVQRVVALSKQSAPDVQTSVISFALKVGAKQGSKALLRRFIWTRIKAQLGRIVNKKVVKQLAKEADEIFGMLEDPWWATAIGFIPLIGDAFDLVNVPRKIRGAIRRANQLEAKVARIIRSQKHAVTGIKFGRTGFPIFDKFAKADLRISATVAAIKNRSEHFKAATAALKRAIAENRINPRRFTKEQLKAIREGKKKIPGFTWHHHQQKGRMQLVPETIHRTTGHSGGFKVWYQ